MHDDIDEATLTREQRAQILRVLFGTRLRPEHLQHYIYSSLTVDEISDEVIGYLGRKDRRLETRGRAR